MLRLAALAFVSYLGFLLSSASYNFVFGNEGPNSCCNVPVCLEWSLPHGSASSSYFDEQRRRVCQQWLFPTAVTNGSKTSGTRSPYESIVGQLGGSAPHFHSKM